MAVLFDALCHPDADLGADNPSVLEWRLEEEHAINHVVLGKLRPGGAWQVPENTLSKKKYHHFGPLGTILSGFVYNVLLSFQLKLVK